MGASRPVPEDDGPWLLSSSWYSSSTFTAQMSWVAPWMFSTVSMAVYIEWSWLLYLCMPLRPTGCTLGAWPSRYAAMMATFAR